MSNQDIKRPALRYHGGKWILAPWIISHFPEHRTYVEPFGGAASVLLRKQRCYSEVYCELDGEVTNYFQILRDPKTRAKLVEAVQLTPFSRAEFELSCQVSDDALESARRLVVRSFMGFGSTVTGRWKTGFRSNSNRSGSTPAHDWANLPVALAQIGRRFKGVVIEERDATKCMSEHDSPYTLHYIDPPYPNSTRNKRWAGRAYKHELTDDDHLNLLNFLIDEIEGMVVISGYRCELYNDMLSGWISIEKETFADGARERTEVLWLSNNCKKSLPLFDSFGIAV